MIAGGSVGAVAARILADLDALAERLVPEYDALPKGVMETEVLPVSTEIIGAFLRAAVEGRDAVVVDDVPVLLEMGKRRLELGVSVEPMLHVYRIAGR